MTDQRLQIMSKLSDVLGVNRTIIQNILMNDTCQNVASSLSQFLMIKTIQSILKKINRTLVRRMSPKTDNKIVEIIDFPRNFAAEATDIMKINFDPPTDDIKHLFDSQHCSFGFVCHLFSRESELSQSSTTSSLTSVSNNSVATLFCLEDDSNLVDQIRDLDILENLMVEDEQLWHCVSKQEFFQKFR